MYKIGVSGHRDLKRNEIKLYKNQIRRYLLEKKEQYGEELKLITPLAQGADMVVTKVAYEIGIKYEVLIPLPKELYVMDFKFSSFKEFDKLIKNAIQVREIDMYLDDENLKKSYMKFKEYHYEKLAVELVDSSDEMLILWDEIYNNKKGGTSELVKYLKKQEKESYFIRVKREAK